MTWIIFSGKVQFFSISILHEKCLPSINLISFKISQLNEKTQLNDSITQQISRLLNFHKSTHFFLKNVKELEEDKK